jgi:hypothetical protein
VSASKPKVFISYSWTSDEYQRAVVTLADRLESDEVDVVIDVWDLRAGQDKYAFMERCANDPTIDKVLVLCDARYAAKADARAGGVGDETAVITPEVFGHPWQTRVIPVVMERDADGGACLPTYLRSRMYVDLSGPDRERGYAELLASIRGESGRSRPDPASPD